MTTNIDDIIYRKMIESGFIPNPVAAVEMLVNQWLSEEEGSPLGDTYYTLGTSCKFDAPSLVPDHVLLAAAAIIVDINSAIDDCGRWIISEVEAELVERCRSSGQVRVIGSTRRGRPRRAYIGKPARMSTVNDAMTERALSTIKST